MRGLTLVDNYPLTSYFENMKKIRAKYIAGRMIEARPEHESAEGLAKRAGFPFTMTVKSLEKRKDLEVGLFYQICKAFGYQIIVYNPNPPKGLEKTYVVGEGESPVTPRERKNKVHYTRDAYNNQLFRSVRKYKRHKEYRKVG